MSKNEPGLSASAGGLVVNPDKKYAIVRQRGGVWSLPKGRIEPEETDLEAAIREITEETNITKLKLVKKLGSYERFKFALDGSEDKSTLKHITLFLFKTPKSELVPSNTTEILEAKWVSYDELLKKITLKAEVDFIKQHASELNGGFRS